MGSAEPGGGSRRARGGAHCDGSGCADPARPRDAGPGRHHGHDRPPPPRTRARDHLADTAHGCCCDDGSAGRLRARMRPGGEHHAPGRGAHGCAGSGLCGPDRCAGAGPPRAKPAARRAAPRWALAVWMLLAMAREAAPSSLADCGADGTSTPDGHCRCPAGVSH